MTGAINGRLASRFTVIKLLSSTTWMVRDSQSASASEYVVLKRAEPIAIERELLCLTDCHSYYIRPVREYLKAENLLLMPFIEGESLLSFTVHQTSEFLPLVPQIVRAIMAMHAQGWVHGDIKPSNVIYNVDKGEISLIDCGSALPSGTALSNLSSWQVTPGFCSADRYEQSHIVLPQDDWYAFYQWLLQLYNSDLTLPEQQLLTRWLNWLTKMKDKPDDLSLYDKTELSAN
ncbi:Serine/Threonine protein kinase [Moritella sp. JT01]|uniref:protein kinase domain-containing protein n=1 Tax=Moritella sp. JT01 TaxID=756698 RepID=UPI0007992DF1|nr:RIO1 family regulatory kinase/ATPase [Moritella sp. JT01]KXO14359.1 Serine/Threonine protein kinase [Moritella sp. JT01]